MAAVSADPGAGQLPQPPELPQMDPVAQRIAKTFDARAAGYDSDQSIHGPMADALLARAAPAAGERVLDLACGTGLVALAAAAAVGSSGRVVGVDLSGAMLQQARAKADAAGVSSWVDWVHGDIEDYPSLTSALTSALASQAALGGLEGSFDIIACSAAAPFLRDASQALRRWRSWLDPARGRLAFNSFVVPAILDFGTFCDVAARHGLVIPDPCARLGSRKLVQDALAAAGFSRVQVDEERQERWHKAGSPQEYAEKMWLFSATGNPHNPVDETVLPPPALAALRAEVVAVIARGAAERFEEGRGVMSPCTLLHVLARP